jgi:hypothetical protein
MTSVFLIYYVQELDTETDYVTPNMAATIERQRLQGARYRRKLPRSRNVQTEKPASKDDIPPKLRNLSADVKRRLMESNVSADMCIHIHSGQGKRYSGRYLEAIIG